MTFSNLHESSSSSSLSNGLVQFAAYNHFNTQASQHNLKVNYQNPESTRMDTLYRKQYDNPSDYFVQNRQFVEKIRHSNEICFNSSIDYENQVSSTQSPRVINRSIYTYLNSFRVLINQYRN